MARAVFGRTKADALIGMRRENEPMVTAVFPGPDPSHRPVHPPHHRAVCIVVEAVHCHWTKALLLCISVPSFPDCGSALIDRIQPSGATTLKQYRIRKIGIVEFINKCIKENRCAKKPRTWPKSIDPEGRSELISRPLHVSW